MMTVSAKEDIALAFYRACNTVFAQRGCTKLVNVSFLWPEDSEEAFMAELTGYIAALCQKEAVKLGLVTASVSSFVQKAVISVTAVGYANADFTDNDGKNQNKTLQNVIIEDQIDVIILLLGANVLLPCNESVTLTEFHQKFL